MFRSTVVPLLACAALSSSALAQSSGEPRKDPNQATFVAVVVGISAYKELPDEAELNFARSDAATVADALKQLGMYDYVFLMTDREASKENIAETLRVKAAQFTGPKDTLLVYFVGHGVGGNLGVPTLLAYDSTLEAADQDGLEVGAFARDIAAWTRAGTTILVTDAIHKNQLESIPFFGPSADQWPDIAPGTMVISSSQANQPGRDGAFGVVFADAISGAADSDSDGTITANELFAYLDKRMIGSGQTPVVTGDSSANLVVARGVAPGMTALGARPDIPIIEKDYEVYAAKFVFRDGANPSVQCAGSPVKVCDPSCYVRNFRAGTCTITAIVDGVETRGKTLALVPGKYDCGLRADKTLSCMPPQLEVTPAPSAP